MRQPAIDATVWNLYVPVGTIVAYVPIAGGDEVRITRTRSQAWTLGDGEPVVKVAGQAGGVALSHCLPFPPEPTPPHEQE